jgi:DNA polymerase III epsilon subunit family exonuclease
MNSWKASLDQLGRSLSETTFVVLDLETSGGSPNLGANITEIGAVKIRGGEVVGNFQSFINPGTPIPYFITALTGITDEMVFEAPRINEVFPSLLEFLGPENETVFVAHNAPFDLSFLKAAAVLHEFRWPKFVVIDTAKLARRVLSREEVSDCKLGTLANFFSATVSPTHRALDDALATVDVLHGLIGRVGSLGVNTLKELQNFSNKRSTVRKIDGAEFF